jgi:hypothetical protein
MDSYHNWLLRIIADSEIPNHAGTTDKSGKNQFGPEKHWFPPNRQSVIKYWAYCIKEPSLFDLQFVHNLFWLKPKWNARSKLFYCIIYRSSMLWWSLRTLTKLKSQSQKGFNERKYQYLIQNIKNTLPQNIILQVVWNLYIPFIFTDLCKC